MAFATLITHLADPETKPDFLQSLAEMAETFDAHLDVVCHGIDRLTPGFQYGGVDPVMMQRTMQAAGDDAKSIAATARGMLEKSNARWSVETSVNPIGNINRSVSMRTRFSDLAVLPTPYGGQNSQLEAEGILEGALFGGQSPVLVLPAGVAANPTPERVILAWNESPEAMNAVRAALPLLKQARSVRVTVIDPPRHGQDRSDPGGPLSVFLARHGVKAEIDVLGKSLPRVCDVLLRHANDKDADMIVMGAYGHSRFREAILGGATRDMLEEAKLPIFMMH
ncbi:universal stress protein [Planktotalea arctica]|uniref:universal stress protein n=1 Tax=Planktotalea arctica TaxID=1481893 RepID=UPI00321AAA19